MLLGLFAPLLIMIYSYSWVTQIMIQSLFWTYYASGSMYPSQGFSLIHPSVWISIWPLVLLRLVPVSQVYRYYKGKTTRRRAVIASMFGDGFFIFYILIMLIISYMIGMPIGMFPIPLPFQLLFCVIMLWRYPIAEPTTPWEGIEHRLWWEKDQEPKEKKPKDEDELW